jgi:hypothetical protein
MVCSSTRPAGEWFHLNPATSTRRSTFEILPEGGVSRKWLFTDLFAEAL